MPGIIGAEYASVNKIDKNPCAYEAHIHSGKEQRGMLRAKFWMKTGAR